MTPQERKLIADLFDRLAPLEDNPRDPDAVQSINDGLDRAPNALYPLVQSVLVQDEALKRADARIRELEDELGMSQGAPQEQSSFLDSMRDTMRGRRDQGSVPSVRPGGQQNWNDAPEQATGSPWRTTRLPPQEPQWNAGGPPPQSQAPWPPQSQAPWNAAPGPGPGPGPGQPQPPYGSPGGGSFLGTAAAAAVGAIGGSMLTNTLKGMLGGGQQGQAHAALDPAGKAGGSSGPTAAGGDLSREAGLNDVASAGSNRMASYDNSGESQRTGLFNTAANDADAYEDDDGDDDGDYDGDDDGDFGDDTDLA